MEPVAPGHQIFLVGFRQVLHGVMRLAFNHEFSALPHNKTAILLHNFRDIGRLNRPPPSGYSEKFLSIQLLRSDQINGTEPCVPPYLRRGPHNRRYGIVIDPASTEKAQTNHLSTSPANVLIPLRSGRASVGTVMPLVEKA